MTEFENHSRGRIGLQELVEKLRSGLKILPNTHETEAGVAAFFGATGWGKSTTINFLCGAEIEEIPKPGGTVSKVLDVVESQKDRFLRIGHAKKSETKTLKMMKADKLYLCDMPGSNDTDRIDDIVNCVIRSKVLLESKEVRPVLVLSFKERESHRGQNYVDAIEYVAKCFETNLHFARLSVLVTQVPPHELDVAVLGFIQECLSELREQARCSCIGTDLLAHLDDRFKNAIIEFQDVGVGETNRSTAIGVVRPLIAESRESVYSVIFRNLSVKDPKRTFKMAISEAAKNALQVLYDEQREIIESSFKDGRFSEVAAILQQLEEVREVTNVPHMQPIIDRILKENKNLSGQIFGQLVDFLSSTPEYMGQSSITNLLEEPLARFKDMLELHLQCKDLLSPWITPEMLRSDYEAKAMSFVQEQLKTKDWSSIDSCVEKISVLDKVMECTGPSTFASEGLNSLFKSYVEDIQNNISEDVPKAEMIAGCLFELIDSEQKLTGSKLQCAQEKLKMVSKLLNESLQCLSDECIRLGTAVATNLPSKQEESDKLKVKVRKLYTLTRDSQIDRFLEKELRNSSSDGYFSRFRKSIPMDLPESRASLLQHSNLLICISEIDDDELGASLKARRVQLQSLVTEIMESDLQRLNSSFTNIFKAGSNIDYRQIYWLEDVISACNENISLFIDACKKAMELKIVDEMLANSYCCARLEHFFQKYKQTLSQANREVPCSGSIDFDSILKAYVLSELCQKNCFDTLSNDQWVVTAFASDSSSPLLFHQRISSELNTKLEKICDDYAQLCEEVDFERNQKYFRWTDEAGTALSLLGQIQSIAGKVMKVKSKLSDKFEEFCLVHLDAFERAVTYADVKSLDIKPVIQELKFIVPAICQSRASSATSPSKTGSKTLSIDRKQVEMVRDSLSSLARHLIDLVDEHATLASEHKNLLFENLDSFLKSRELRTLNALAEFEGFIEVQDVSSAHQQLLRSFNNNLSHAISMLSEDSPDFGELADFVSAALEHDRREILNRAFSKLRRDSQDILSLMNELEALSEDDLKRLQSCLKRLERGMESALFPKFSEVQQRTLSSFFEELTARLRTCIDDINESLKKESYSPECIVFFNCLKFANRALHREAKQLFYDHFTSIITNPGIDGSMMIMKKFGSSSEFKNAFGNDWQDFVERFLEKIRCFVVEKIGLISKSLKNENVAEAEDQMEKTESLMANHFISTHFPAEKQKLIDLTAKRTSLLSHHTKTVADSLEDGDYKNAIRSFYTSGSEQRNMQINLFRKYVQKLKKLTDDEQIGKKERKSLFIKTTDLLNVFKESLQDPADEAIMDLIDKLQENVNELQEVCVAEIVETSKQIVSLLSQGIAAADFLRIGPCMTEFKRLKQLPLEKFANAEMLTREREAAIVSIRAFCSNAHTFFGEQFQFIIDDSPQLNAKELKKAVHNALKYLDILKDMEDIVSKKQEPLDRSLSSSVFGDWSTFQQCCNLKLEETSLDKQRVIESCAQNGFSDAKITNSFNTLMLISAEFPDVVQSISRKTKDIVCDILGKFSALAIEKWDARDHEEVSRALESLSSACKRFEHTSIQEIKSDAKKALDEATRPLCEHFNKIKKEIIESPESSRSCCEKINALRKDAGLIPTMLHYTIKIIGEALHSLQSTHGDEFISDLGQMLLVSEWGKYSVSEQPILKHIKGIVYLTKIPSLACSDVVPKMSGIEFSADKLVKCVENYNSIFAPLLGDYIKNVDSTFASRKQRLIAAVIRYGAASNPDQTELIALVCTLLAMIKTGDYGCSMKSQHIMAPHTIQVASILRLLGVDRSGPTVFEHARSLLTNLSLARDRIKNHVLQIPTGEGKSIVLGVVACVFALQKLQVDCVCYSKYLSRRDFDDFKEIFEALGIEKQIRYLTFQELCESHIHGIREAVLGLITQGSSANSSAKSQLRTTKGVTRILLIDEVDVFFKRQFYGGTLNAGVLLQSPSIENLIKLIWSHRNGACSLESIKSTKEYSLVTTEFADIAPVIESAVKSMVINVKNFGNPRYEVRQGLVGYVINQVFETEVSYPNRTVFAYIHEHELNPQNITSDTMKRHMGIGIRCGEFSYASMPKRYYSSTFGVTGTLTTLPDPDKTVLKKEFGVDLTTIAPSVYGNSNLDFNFQEPMHVVVEDSVATWRRKIAEVAQRESANKRPVLICFKNDTELDEYAKAHPFRGTQLLTSREEDADIQAIQGKVLSATFPQKITLLTRKYGRGVDFLSSSKDVASNGGVLLIQTFYSSTLSEEAQIKGRVARQGEPGSFRLILCAEHVQKKFGISVIQLPRKELEESLKKARESKVLSKIASRNLRKQIAEQKDSNAMSLLDVLMDKEASREKKLKQFLLNALGSPRRNYVLMLDVSGSMHALWPSLADAFNLFIKALKESRNDVILTSPLSILTTKRSLRAKLLWIRWTL